MEARKPVQMLEVVIAVWTFPIAVGAAKNN